MTTPASDFPRTAIVTGSDSGIGIGKATAVTLAAAGCDVGITYPSDSDGARATADEVRSYGRRAEVRELDLSDVPGAADVQRAARRMISAGRGAGWSTSPACTSTSPRGAPRRTARRRAASAC